MSMLGTVKEEWSCLIKNSQKSNHIFISHICKGVLLQVQVFDFGIRKLYLY